MKIFRNKEKSMQALMVEMEKSILEVKENAIEYMLKIENDINTRLEFRFEHLEKSGKTDECIEKLGKKISVLETELANKNEFIKKLFEVIDKLVNISEKDKDKLKEKIEELKKQVPTRLRPTKATVQKMGIKSGTKTSKIIKKVKEN
jgi:ElaB/YqjD/DUF883 family membrane-anchored ribosome-binding protein